MILTPKPLASLSSGLLARKGQARPAMRPQGFASFPTAPQQLDDLGWNDMGDDALTPVDPNDPSLPGVLQERASLIETLSVTPDPVPVAGASFETRSDTPAAVDAVGAAPADSFSPLSKKSPRVRPAAVKAKAAFTLRLDAGRHLRLRLASALQNRSSQQLVTYALDMFLSSLPEVEAMAISQSQPGATNVTEGE